MIRNRKKRKWRTCSNQERKNNKEEIQRNENGDLIKYKRKKMYEKIINRDEVRKDKITKKK